MSRNIEISIGEYYHLYNRGNNKRKVFLEQSNYKRFLMYMYICNCRESLDMEDLKKIPLSDFFNLERKKTLIDIGVYCLMPNHFHILAKEKIENGISLFIQKISTGYTMYFNKKYDKSGSLFQGRFKARHVTNEEYLRYLFSYIHLNPIKIIDPNWKENDISNLSYTKNFLATYPYSSYLDYIGNKRDFSTIINNEAFPQYFEKISDFENLIDEWLLYKTEGSTFPREG